MPGAAHGSVHGSAPDGDDHHHDHHHDTPDAPEDAPFTPSQQLALASAIAGRLRVVSVDPGRVAIVTCGEWVTDSSAPNAPPRWVSWRLSRSQFYAETGYEAAMRQRQRWNLEVAEAHAALATVSVRTGSLERFDQYLSTLETHLEALWRNREHTRWMRLVREVVEDATRACRPHFLLALPHPLSPCPRPHPRL